MSLDICLFHALEYQVNPCTSNDTITIIVLLLFIIYVSYRIIKWALGGGGVHTPITAI